MPASTDSTRAWRLVEEFAPGVELNVGDRVRSGSTIYEVLLDHVAEDEPISAPHLFRRCG